MSADLLDLDDFFQSPPPQQQQQGAQQIQSQQQQSPQQATTSSTDLFDFASLTNSSVSGKPAAPGTSVEVLQTQPWPNLEIQQPSGLNGGSNGGWGDLSSFSSGFMSSSTSQTQSQPQQQQPLQLLQQQQQQPKQAQQDADDDDGWGDFEVAEPTPTQHSFVLPPQTNKARASPPPRTRVARASTFDLMSNNLINVVDVPRGSGLSPIPSPGFPPENPQSGARLPGQMPGSRQPSPGPAMFKQHQPDRQPSPRLSFQAPSSKPPASPGLVAQRSPAKPQPSDRRHGQMPGVSRDPSPNPARKDDANILFDAEDFELQGGNEEDDDDFGDFESVQTPFPGGNMSPQFGSKPAKQQQHHSSQPPSMDLLSLDDDPFTVPQPTSKKPQLSSLSLNTFSSPYPQAPKSPSYQERNPFPGLGLTTPTSADFKKNDKPKSPEPITAWPSFGQTSPIKPSKAADKPPTITQKTQEEEWGAFEDFPDDEPSALDSSRAPESWDWDAVDNVKTTAPDQAPAAKDLVTQPKTETELIPDIPDDAPPPINIPPPSVLLSIFPQLLELANSSLFKSLSGQMPPVKKKILSDPATVTFLRGYLLLATVAARIIAGRKLRWHRDKFLSQGMAISAAGAKGMKLAGVDKAQAAREERETADVVSVWKENVGRLRSAVAGANSAIKSPHEQLRIPEISETIPVSTAKVVPTAPKACIVCGLKREERVAKVDVDVEDSFGEWWVEHWGHRACKNFWVEHEKQLRQR
ncbi:hypothetical protein CCHL11_03417 [Colletotrichum chlorophyti]|uniref:Serine/threonine-protein kinase ppk6 n=1 Tax=Colletotrichum chlorophyti TaxID=708187 RepID=A0A1Q8S0B5_9PEZI|nr:hypothetical protein CCHL11_03417 [Colletotrichum chlorophyti]